MGSSDLQTNSKQKRFQNADAAQRATKARENNKFKVKDFLKGVKRSKWTREQQRHYGSHRLWQVVSFTGKIEPNVLEAVLPKSSEPDEVAEPADGGVAECGKGLTCQAAKARDPICHAKSL